MGQDQLELWKAVENAREHQRAEAQRGVEGVLRDLRQREFLRALGRHRLHRMDEDRRVEVDRRLPELVHLDLAEIGAFDIRGDAQADGVELGHRIFGFLRGVGRVGQRNGCEQREPFVIGGAHGAEMLVQQPVPARAGFARQAVGEDV